jgi:hypothetical protein
MKVHIGLVVFTLLLGLVVGWIVRTKLDEYLEMDNVFDGTAEDPVTEDKKLIKGVKK